MGRGRRFFCGWIGALWVCAGALAAESPRTDNTPPDHAPEPVIVTLYYSAEAGMGEKVPAALQQLQSRHGQQVRITRISIDDVDGYRRLRAHEKAVKLRRGFAPVEAFIAAGPDATPFVLLGEDQIASYLHAAVTRLLEPTPPRWREVDEATVLGLGERLSAAEVQPIEAPAGIARAWTLRDGDGRTVGRISELRLDIACPICHDAQFLVAQDARGNVRAVAPVIAWEKPDPERIAAFLKQLGALEHGQDVVIGRDVDTVTGATKTSRAYLRGVKQALASWPERAGEARR